MVKDVQLYLDEAKRLGVTTEVADAVARLWEVVIDEVGPESDFTAAIIDAESAAGKRERRGRLNCCGDAE